jgi:RNA polymerase sigma-70 factor (ECF subfamily)
MRLIYTAKSSIHHRKWSIRQKMLWITIFVFILASLNFFYFYPQMDIFKNNRETNPGEKDGSASAAGKQEQFMLLYKPAHERLSRFVHSMVWNYEDARDIIAETVLKAYENFEKIENRGAFVYYLFGIASRLSKRRSRRIRVWAPYDNEYAENIVDSSADIARKMEIDVLYKAMKRLPEKQREALSLFEISGFSLAEIQQIQGGSLSGVKSRIVRGREALAQIIRRDQKTVKSINFESALKKAAIV